MEKLELRHIAPYLPYGLKIKSEIGKGIIFEVNYYGCGSIGDGDRIIQDITKCKPYLLPLSSLYKPLEDGTTPIVELAKIATGIDWSKRGWEQYDVHEISTVDRGDDIIFGFSRSSFSLKYRARTKLNCTTWVVPNQLALFDYCYSKHIDLGNLIGKGLALEKGGEDESH